MSDIVQDSYIHFHNINFVNYRKNLNYNVDWSAIAQIYWRDAGIMRQKMVDVTQHVLDNKQNQTVSDILGLINELEDSTIYKEMIDGVSLDLREIIPQSLAKIGMVTARGENSVLETGEIKQSLAAMESFINSIETVLESVSQCSLSYLEYLQNNISGEQALSELGSDGSNIAIIGMNKTAITSYNSLITRLNILKAERDNLKGTKKRRNITYVDSKGKKKTVNYTSFIYSFRYLLTNILGGFGETVGAAYAVKQLEEHLLKLADKNMSIEIHNIGTKRINNNISKGDYSLSILNDNLVQLSFEISGKAQKLRTNTSQKITTVFDTTDNLENYLAYINEQERYILLNSIYRASNSVESKYIRQKIAAQNMLKAITGKMTGGDVFFIQYLDSLIRVDEFLEHLAKAGERDPRPTISISGVKNLRNTEKFLNKHSANREDALAKYKNYADQTPDTKNTLAWARSHYAINEMNKLKAQIKYIRSAQDNF